MKNQIFYLLRVSTLILVISIYISSCKKENLNEASSIEVVVGVNQSAEVETVLTNPITIVVKDQNGNAFANATVNFSVTEGNVSSTVEKTDAEGNAGVTWTLGSTIGVQTLIIKAYKADGITELTGSPLSITANASIPSSVTDIDGNTYSVVEIGDQIWMAENLNVTKYPDGTDIPKITDNVEWANLGNTDDAYCYYENNTYGDTYGVLYTWTAAMGNDTVSSYSNPSGIQGVCPDGWHIPSDSEWTELTDYLGGVNLAGGKMKEAGNNHWYDPNTGATNESGFTALPGGYRSSTDGNFYYIRNSGRFWSGTIYDDTVVWSMGLTNTASMIYRSRYYNRSYGTSVRCIRD